MLEKQKKEDLRRVLDSALAWLPLTSLKTNMLENDLRELSREDDDDGGGDELLEIQK